MLKLVRTYFWRSALVRKNLSVLILRWGAPHRDECVVWSSLLPSSHHWGGSTCWAWYCTAWAESRRHAIGRWCHRWTLGGHGPPTHRERPLGGGSL